MVQPVFQAHKGPDARAVVTDIFGHYSNDTHGWDGFPLYIGKNISTEDAHVAAPEVKKKKRVVGMRSFGIVLEVSLMGLLLDKGLPEVSRVGRGK